MSGRIIIPGQTEQKILRTPGGVIIPVIQNVPDKPKELEEVPSRQQQRKIGFELAMRGVNQQAGGESRKRRRRIARARVKLARARASL